MACTGLRATLDAYLITCLPNLLPICIFPSERTRRSMLECHFCRGLDVTPLNIPIRDLRLGSSGVCPSCRLLCDAVTCVLGTHWEDVYDHILLPARAPTDKGPLRIEVKTRNYQPNAGARDVVLQLYTKQGNSRFPSDMSSIGRGVDRASRPWR